MIQYRDSLDFQGPGGQISDRQRQIIETYLQDVGGGERKGRRIIPLIDYPK